MPDATAGTATKLPTHQDSLKPTAFDMFKAGTAQADSTSAWDKALGSYFVAAGVTKGADGQLFGLRIGDVMKLAIQESKKTTIGKGVQKNEPLVALA